MTRNGGSITVSDTAGKSHERQGSSSNGLRYEERRHACRERSLVEIDLHVH